MEIKITEKKDNLFFNRTEVDAEVLHPGEPTPKRADVKKAIADALGVSQDLVAVRQCKSQFGTKSICKAAVYKTKEDLEKFEPEYVMKRGAEKKPPVEEKAEASAEAAPATAEKK